MYFIYLAIIILIPIYAQMKVKSTYKKYSKKLYRPPLPV